VLVSVLAVLAMAVGGASSATQPVTPAPGDQFSPAIAFTGASYLVAWSDRRAETESTRALRPQLPPPPPPPPPPPRSDVFGTRVSRAGRALDVSGLAIAKEAHQGAGPAVASDGTNAFVVWTDRQGSAPGVVYGARITRAGAILDRAGLSIYSGQGEHAEPAVSFDGTNYLVVWRSTVWPAGWFLDAARVTPSGTVLDPAAIRISSTYAWSPAVASGGTNSLVVWLRGGVGGSLVGARISPSGVVLDPNPIEISCPPNYSCTSNYANEPAVAFDGTNYLVAWSESESGNIFGTRISLAGTVLDPGGIRISHGVGRAGKPTISFGGTNYLVAWEDTRFGCCSIFGTRVSPSGNVLDPGEIAIATRGREQVEPAAVFDGTNYLVAWTDNRSVVNSGSDIYGAHVTQDGRVLEARGILLSTAVRRAPCVVPRVLGQRLATARARIRRAHCSVGRIHRTRSGRSGRVVEQTPRAGAKRRRGYPVRLEVGGRG